MADFTIAGAISALEALGDKIAAEGVSIMQGEVPVRTGALQGSVHSERTGSQTWFVGTDIHYAGYVEYGRGDVWPVTRKVLRFADGSFHPHAGPAKANDFVGRTAAKLNAMSFSL